MDSPVPPGATNEADEGGSPAAWDLWTDHSRDPDACGEDAEGHVPILTRRYSDPEPPVLATARYAPPSSGPLSQLKQRQGKGNTRCFESSQSQIVLHKPTQVSLELRC
jgi:hypothetical protein